MTEILAWIGGATLGGIGLVAAAYWIFQTWGERWLQNRFDRQLEDLRHQQAQEMEAFRFRINRTLDRSTKLHKKEFEIVPEAWRRLVDAYYGTSAHISAFRQLPGFMHMNDEQMEEALKDTELYESQKQQVRDARPVDRGHVYSDVIYWHDKARVEQTARNFTSYLEKFGIFISNKSAFDEMGDLIWEALLEYRHYREIKLHEREKADRLDKEGKEKLRALEADIHRRFWRTDITADEGVGSLISPPTFKQG